MSTSQFSSIDSTLPDPAITRLIEQADTEGWADHQLAAPPALVEEFGFQLRRLHGATIMIASRAGLSGLNRVLGLGLEGPVTGPVLDEVLGVYRAVGVSRCLLQLGPLADGGELTELLRARKIVAKTRNAKLWRHTDATLSAQTSLEIVEVGRDSAQLYGETVTRAYGDPPVLAAGHSATLGRPGWRHFMALDDGRAVAGATLFTFGEIAWCGFAATLAADRGKGAHCALLARRVRAAAENGCTLVACETAEETVEKPNPSFRNMRRVGFELAYFRPNFVWKAPA